MTSKSDSSEEEWRGPSRTPLVAGMAILVADPSGPVGATKEAMATIRTATDPTTREHS